MSFSALRNVGFVIQTIHKLYTNKPQTLHKTQHCNYAQNPAQQRCILFLNADKNEMSEWLLNADKTNGANVLPVVVMRVASPPFPFCFSFDACISHDSHSETTHESIHEHSWREKLEEFRRKNQQFWAFFQRFGINIFNLREHFSPPNFAYSARNFSLPSPN